MAKQKRPTRMEPMMPVDPEVVRRKLTELLDQTGRLRGGGGVSSPEFGAWKSDVVIALSKFYGPSSEEYSRFKRILFAPVVGYSGQP
jgi:hypothetical protein